jgi:putative ABC transport system permease protein
MNPAWKWSRVRFQRLAGVFNKQRRDMELAQELESHLQFHIEDNLRSGMTPQAARRDALLKLGGIEQTKESVRDLRGVPWLETLLQDLRFGLRMLRKSPGFSAVAVLTLALGIGANTAIFSVVDAVLLKPLPFPQRDHLISMWGVNPSRGWTDNPISPRWFVEWQKQNHVFADMAAFEPISFNLSGTESPEEVTAERTTTNLFSVLGVAPVLGRGFVSDESRPDSRTAVLGYGLWQRKFAGDPQAVGRQIRLNGDSYTIVGILPADFSHRYTSPFMPSPQLWVAGFEPKSITSDEKGYLAIARLKAGVTLQQAQAEMDTIARRVEQLYPDDKGWGVALYRAEAKSVEYSRPAVLVLWAAVFLVLLIACANLASLLLARGESRRRELAVRTALGASHGRLVRQFLTESVLLAVMSASLGLLLAAWSVKLLVVMTPPILLRAAPGLESVGINVRVLGYCLLVATVTGLLFGLAPALSGSSANASDSLKENAKGTTHSRQSHQMRGFLVASEFALALLLLVGAGLMIKTLRLLSKLDLGFDPSNVLTMKLPLLGAHFRETPQRVEFLRELLPRVNALPGVQSASVTRGLPVEDWSGWSFITGDNPNPAAGEVPDANYNIVGPQYFSALGVSVQSGRSFAEADTESSQPVVIVSEQLARHSWPGQNPLGKRLKIASSEKDSGAWRVVVGVAGNVMSQGPDGGFNPELYIPYTQAPWFARVSLVIRTASEPTAIIAAVRQEISQLDGDLPVSEIKTLVEVAGEPVAQRRMVMTLLAGLAALALVLAGAGVYSVMSYIVTLSTPEIGLRMALGAQPSQVLRTVLGRGLRLVFFGMAAGVVAALALTRVLGNLLYGLSASDPQTFIAVTILLTAIAVAACYIPARRATKVDPMVALRYE